MIYDSARISVVLIEEQKVIREGLKILLESESDIKIVGSFSNSQDAIFKIAELKPNIVLVSVELSGVEVSDVIQEIQQKLGETKIIVFCDSVNANNFVQYLELGVKGCLLKEVSPRKIREIVRYINQGYTHIEDDIFKTVLPQLSDAISALTIADAEVEDTLNSPQSKVIFNGQFESPTLDYEVNSQSLITSPRFYLPVIKDLETQDSFPGYFAQESGTKKWWKKGAFNLSLAGLGLFAIAIGIISYRQETSIVIKNGVVNGKLVTISSPVEGQLQELIYLEGMNLEANQLFGFVEPVADRNATQLIEQLEKDISLKQEQIKNAQEFLSFLERQLQVLPQKSAISLNIPQAESETTISIDNSREIMNLERQIFNQKSANGFLLKELKNLQEKLNDTQANLANNQKISLEAPISGAIYSINHLEGELIPMGAEIATLIDCQNLWVEAIIDSKLAAKINLQKNVSIQLENRESLILGQVNRIESLNEQQSWHLGDRNQTTKAKSIALTSTRPTNSKIGGDFSRVIVNVDLSNSELVLQEFCNVGLNAQISINN